MIVKERKPSFFNEVTVNNPMMVEFRHIMRRIRNKSYFIPAVCVWIAGIVCYGLFMLNCQFPDAALFVVSIKFVVLTLLLPLLGYAVVCGERDRRTWEALLSAPISVPQLIVGKFTGLIASICAGFVAALPFEVIGLIAAANGTFQFLYTPIGIYSRYTSFTEPLLLYLRYNLYAFVVLAFLASVVFFFSARAVRPLGSLAMSLGVTIGVSTIFVSVAGLTFTDPAAAATAPLSPVAIGHMFHAWAIGWQSPFGFASIFPEAGVVLYAALTGAMLFYSQKTILFADKEVPFLPQKKTNA